MSTGAAAPLLRHPDPAPANLQRLWAALQELRAEPRDLDDFRAAERPPFDLDSLIAGRPDMLKRATGRDQDLIDVEALRQAEGLDS